MIIMIKTINSAYGVIQSITHQQEITAIIKYPWQLPMEVEYE